MVFNILWLLSIIFSGYLFWCTRKKTMCTVGYAFLSCFCIMIPLFNVVLSLIFLLPELPADNPFVRLCNKRIDW